MKVKVRWTYTYMQEDTFEEVVEVDAPTFQEAMDEACTSAMRIPNGDLTPIESHWPGDPVDCVESYERVPDDTKARIRAVFDGDPELL